MKSKLTKPEQKRPSYSLFLSQDDRLVLQDALVSNPSTGAKAKGEEKEHVIKWAEQVRSQATVLQALGATYCLVDLFSDSQPRLATDLIFRISITRNSITPGDKTETVTFSPNGNPA
jgi:hypothetical protein